MVTLKRRVWSRLIKTAWLVVFLLVLLTALGGCAWLQNSIAPNQAPVAVISANSISGETPLEVAFDASESYDPDGEEISYKWDFGDAKIGQEQTVTHVFTSPGNHIVQLIVTDTKGAKDVSSITIIVTLETVSDTIGISGGTVSTSQGSSVTVPANTLANGSAVSISELVEPVIKFKPSVEAIGNGMLITVSSSNINTTALKSQSLVKTTPGIIAIRVPLLSNMQAPSPDVIRGFLLEFTAGDRSTQMVIGMDQEGDVAKVSVPIESIAEFASGTSCNAPNKAITSGVSCWFSRISVRMFAKSAGHIPPLLYRAESSSDFVPVGFIPTVNEASTSYTSQDPSIIPIILIHGYKVARADEVAITALCSGTSPGYEDYAQTSWKDFIDYFYEHCHADLKKKLPAGYDFKLYVYRWDTDEGLDKAGTGLAGLINGCFGDRPFMLIGHSAGGIVARACVEHNQSLVSNFPGIITLASPHLGVPALIAHSLILDKSGQQLTTTVTANERLSWIRKLNKKTTENKDWSKYIVYGGYVRDPLAHKPALLRLGWALESIFEHPGLQENDGIVPLDSALVQGYPVRERHDPYEDYDHGEMLYGKEGDSHLFRSICDDLQELAGELAVPVAVAGDNQVADVGVLLTLDGSASYDSQGHPLTFYWRQVGGPPASLSDQTAMNLTFTPTVPGTYTFQLVVNNGQMDSPPDDVNITVTNVNRPDLTVSSVGLSTSSANPGENVSVTFTVENKGGPISGEFRNRVFLSTTRYGGQGGRKILLGEFSMSLQGSNFGTQAVNITIPQISSGNWYIAVYTDCNEIVTESNESNNINSAEIVIDELVDHSPVVRITSPADGTEFTEGETITFQGSATDPEDGTLVGSSLVWTSSMDSQIGTGESVTTNTLSAGTHTITLTATDSDGNSASASTNITVSSAGPTPPRPATSEGKIAFVSNRDGQAEIYVMNADGSNVRRLTYTPGGLASQAPTWSPAGRKIAFISGGDWDGDGYVGLGLCIMDSDGNNVREIRVNTNIPVGYINNLAWSPDGTRFAFVAPDPTYTNFDVYTMNIDGSDVRKLSTDGKSAWTPSWSPDSKYIAFSSTRDPADLRDIYIMDADGSNQRHLSNSPPFSSEPAWSPDGTRLACTGDYNDIWVMNIDGSNQIKLTDDPIGDYNCHPFWSPDGTRIAFVSNRDGNQEIYVANVDGSGETRLTNNDADDWAPTWSLALSSVSNSFLESKGKIAFASGRDRQGGIYVMNSDGSSLQRLSYGGQGPAWSPGGKYLIFATAGASLGAIYVMKNDGSNVRKIVDKVHGCFGIAWSPNGSKIAFASSPSQLDDSDIYVIHADGTNLHNITNYPAIDDSPTWSPDGTRIGFRQGVEGDIYVMDADGGNVQRLTFAPDGLHNPSEPAWSPNGDKMAVTIGLDIYVMNVDGGDLQQLTDTGMNASPTWSPDSARIAFVSWRDGNQELYVMNADGFNQHNITNNPAEDWDPAWSPVLPAASDLTPRSGGEKAPLPLIPDLFVSSVNLSTSSANPGGNASVTFTVQNKGGPVSRGFKNRVFLTPVTRYGVGQEITLGEFPMSLDGSNSKTQPVSIVIPKTMEMGDWYVAVYTDCNAIIDETDANNNTNSAEISIGAWGGTVPDNGPPSATIISPKDGSSFAEGDVITFQGQATDPEDGTLTGDTLLWYSDLVGNKPLSVLGTGESISVNWLSAGSYIISVIATDSDGYSSSASINMTVSSAEPTPPLPGPSEGKIAFASARDGYIEIYVMNADGSNQHNISNNRAGDRDPAAWSLALPVATEKR